MLCFLAHGRRSVVGSIAFVALFAAGTAWANQDSKPTESQAPAANPGTPSLIPHSLEGRADCLSCHGPVGAHPAPADHRNRTNKTCLSCHVPARAPNAPSTAKRSTIPVTNNFCLSCHGSPSVSMTLPSGESLSLFVDIEVYQRSTHGRNHMPCTACHSNHAQYPHPPVSAKSRRELARSIVQQSCFQCHEKVFEQFKDSVHGKALIEKGNLDVPSCTDCHGVHDIDSPHTALFRMESPDTCSKCHADPKLAEKYGLSSYVTQSYLNDFHGATIRLVRKENPNINSYKAVCYDCHGIHDIRKADDPESRVVREKLVETCQRCHPGADSNFPAAWTSHYAPDRKRWPIVYWVDTAYKYLIPSVLGPMVLYILLDLMRTLINRLKGVKHG